MNAVSLPRPRLANAHFVTDFLAVGGDVDMYDADLADEQLDELTGELGITHVLDVRQEWDDSELWAGTPEVTYRWAGIDDAGQRVPAAWFEDVVTWSLSALEAPGSRLLAHCHMGVNRGPSVGFAVLLGLGWDPVDAIEAIRSARPVAAVAYAEDALRWHHERTGAGSGERRRDRDRLAQWRREHPLDVVRVIAQRRAAGE